MGCALGCAAGQASDPVPSLEPSAPASVSAAAATAVASATSTPTTPTAVATLSAMPELPSPFACGSMNRDVETFATAPGASLLTSNADALFWSDGQVVHRISPAGESKKILSGVGAPIVDLLTFGPDLFVVRRKDEGFCAGSVERFDAANGSRSEVISTRCVDRLAVSSTHFAWIGLERFPTGYVETRASVKAREPGAAVTLLTRTVSSMSGIALSSDHFVLSLGAGRVESAALSDPNRLAAISGPAPVRFGFGYTDQRLVSVDATHAYFYGSGSRPGGLRVFRAPLDGQTTETIGSYADLDQPGPPSRTWAVNGTHLHFALPGANRVFRADKSGRCGVELLASEQKRPDSPALVGDSLFWLELSAKPIAISRIRL
jgi:hypothetical protein